MPPREIHHYDLFERRQGWTANSMLIVSPYVEPTFFKRLLSGMRPKLLTVVVDDSCRWEDVRMLRKLANGQTKVVVALGGAPGLVHLKLFHTVWCTPRGNRMHTLAYGSGNATHQAFRGDFNSELMCWSRLTASRNHDTIEWLKSVRVAAQNPSKGIKIPALWTELVRGLRFRLPELTVRETASKADNFDLWLQRGHLLSAYRPDAAFLRVTLPLKKRLPPGDLESRIIETGFDIQETSRLSIPYVPVATVSGESGRWRSKFFTETDLGEWCSEACYRAKRHLFQRNGYQGREESLRRLEAILINDVKTETVRCDYLSRIDRLWKVLGPSAGTYLQAINNRVDVGHYLREFEDRLKRDNKLAQDREFKDRYLKGFAVVPVPRFRLDTTAWTTFRQYFIAQLHYDSLRQRAPGLLFRRIKSALGEAGLKAIAPEKLELFLIKEWNLPAKCKDADGLTVGEYIDDYHATG